MKIALTLFVFFAAYVSVSAQDAVSIDEAILEASGGFTNQLPKNASVAVIALGSDSPRMSSYIINGLTKNLGSGGGVKTIDPSALENARKKLNVELFDTISAETALAIGKSVKAQFVIYGSTLLFEGGYYLEIRVLRVDTRYVFAWYIKPISGTPE